MAKSKVQSSFSVAMAFTGEIEGGYSDDPNDPGGETIYGISKRAHPEAWVDGPPSKELARAIFMADYWRPLRCDELPLPLALALFDTAVNSGQRRAVQMLQMALNDQEVLSYLAVDGVLGPRTMARALEFKIGRPVALRQTHHRRRYYNRLARRAWARTQLRGWFRRTLDLDDVIWQKTTQPADNKRQPALAWPYMP